MFDVAETTGSDLLANVTSQLSDTGTLAIVAIAAGVPLAFYVIRRLVALIPSGR
jgi:hypothetical protein